MNKYKSETLLGSYLKGDQNTGIHYYLMSVMGLDGNRYYVIVRNYGERGDGTPWEDVTICGIDDGTCESYCSACTLFYRMVG